MILGRLKMQKDSETWRCSDADLLHLDLLRIERRIASATCSVQSTGSLAFDIEFPVPEWVSLVTYLERQACPPI